MFKVHVSPDRIRVFQTEEEKVRFLVSETRFTQDFLRALWSAICPEERVKARQRLVSARIEHDRVWEKRKQADAIVRLHEGKDCD